MKFINYYYYYYWFNCPLSLFWRFLLLLLLILINTTSSLDDNKQDSNHNICLAYCTNPHKDTFYWKRIGIPSNRLSNGVKESCAIYTNILHILFLLLTKLLIRHDKWLNYINIFRRMRVFLHSQRKYGNIYNPDVLYPGCFKYRCL